jgi:hypothetical protein
MNDSPEIREADFELRNKDQHSIDEIDGMLA